MEQARQDDAELQVEKQRQQEADRRAEQVRQDLQGDPSPNLDPTGC